MLPPLNVLRVAIVGLGPKGLFALERLVDRAAQAGRDAAIDVHAFEAHAVPGAGPIYDPSQPPYLRMNFAAEHIDMWAAWESTIVPPADQRSFTAWSRDQGRPCEPGSYPARADVGRYLATGLATLLDHAPPNATVTVHRARVHAVQTEGSQWRIWAEQGHGPFDEVLIATGHEPSSRCAPGDGCGGTARVFPVERELSRRRVPPGATVAARGFALTLIDAALALTEGRGGTFEPLDHPYRLRYLPAGDEVGVIFPFSRTGRPMLAKPGPLAAHGAAAGLALAAIARGGRDRLSGLAEPVELGRDLLAVLGATARASLLAAGGAPQDLEQLTAWLEGAAAGRPVPAGPGGAADEIDQSLAVGAGLAPCDPPWALGLAWRGLYPAVVARLSHGGLAPSDWPGFRRLAGELERVSFGPSPLNAAKLLALIDAGIVDLRHVAGGRLDRSGRAPVLAAADGRAPVPVDVVIDAVLPGPGAGGGGVLGTLLAGGHVHVADGRRGLVVDVDGGCRRADGSRSPGLSAIGRPTEDVVIGNDTLNPRLHELADRWARRVAARAALGSARAEGRALSRR